MSVLQRSDSAAFAGLLTSDFVANSVPEETNIDPELELIKGKAALLALTMFDPGKREVRFGANATFGSVFSQDVYGAGFTKGLSILSAYLICLEEEGLSGQSKFVSKFTEKVQETANQIFKRISSGDCKLSDVRKMAEQIDNYGGYYQATKLSETAVKALTPGAPLKCPLEIDPNSGHLTAKISPDLSQQLLDVYRSEIETYLTEDGKKNLKLPFNTGFVIVAYKDELSTVPGEKLDAILHSNPHVNLSFQSPYVIPVRGDNRYSLVACTYMESPDIKTTRATMELGELYSEGRPLRFTFGAVYNAHLLCDDESLIKRMRQSQSLKPWMDFIDKKIEARV